VAVIVFLKYALDVLSFNVKFEARRTLTNNITSTIKVGKNLPKCVFWAATGCIFIVIGLAMLSGFVITMLLISETV